MSFIIKRENDVIILNDAEADQIREQVEAYIGRRLVRKFVSGYDCVPLDEDEVSELDETFRELVSEDEQLNDRRGELMIQAVEECGLNYILEA